MPFIDIGYLCSKNLLSCYGTLLGIKRDLFLINQSCGIRSVHRLVYLPNPIQHFRQFSEEFSDTGICIGTTLVVIHLWRQPIKDHLLSRRTRDHGCMFRCVSWRPCSAKGTLGFWINWHTCLKTTNGHRSTQRIPHRHGENLQTPLANNPQRNPGC